MVCVSVVIPCTDRTQGLRRAVDSALNQKFEGSIEVILVENNSKNRSLVKAVVDDIGDVRVRHVYLEDCKNANVARNYGASLSCAEYLAFLDSDDEWLPVFLDACLDKMLAGNAGGVFTGFNCVSREGSFAIIGSTSTDMEKDLIVRRSVDVRSSCLFFRRSLFDAVKFDENLFKHQDWGLMLDFSKKYNISYVPSALVNIHIGSNRMSAKLNIEASVYFIEQKLCESSKSSFALSRMTECIYMRNYDGFVLLSSYVRRSADRLGGKRLILRSLYLYSAKSHSLYYVLILIVKIYRDYFVRNK